MALHTNVRVRLDLREAISKLEFSSLHPLCWISVNKTDILDIRGLKALIKSRYSIIEEVNFQLYLQNCLLPDDEPVDLLRDDDLLKCVLDSHSEGQQSTAYHLNSSKEYTPIRANEAPKKRKSEVDEHSNVITEEVDFLTETVDRDKRKKKKKKTEHQTKRNHEEMNVADDMETEIIIPECSPLDSKSTEREELLKMLHRMRDNLTIKSKASSEHMPEKKKQSPQHIVPDVSNSSKHIDNPIPQNEETPSAHVHGIAAAACNGSTVSNLDSSYCNSHKDSDFEVENSFENVIKLEKKKRKRRRRNKSTKVSPMSAPPLIPFEQIPIVSSDVYFPNHNMGKHIRFDDPNSSLVAADAPSKNQHTEEQNEAEEFNDVSLPVTSAFNRVQDGDIKSEILCQSNLKHYKELSKDKQINSVCTNKSIILLNCFGAYPDGDGILNNPSTVETLKWNADAYKSVVDTKQPKKYEDYPQLCGPPRIGDHIAFKILELSETYCPEVSEFKEGKVVKCENDLFDVKLFGDRKKKYNKGKFELVYSDEENGSEGTWNNNVPVQICWSDMIEPRLLNMT